MARLEERKFVRMMTDTSQKETARSAQKARDELFKVKIRITTLDHIISKIYEDNISGKISDERFKTMLGDYETEQTNLKIEVIELESFVVDPTQQAMNMDRFLRLVHTHTEVTELTAEIVHKFINRIEVSEAVWTPARFSHWAKGKTQNVRILYNYLDDINAKLIIKQRLES